LPSKVTNLVFLAGKTLGTLHKQLCTFMPDCFNPDGFNPQTGKRWRDTEWFLNKIQESSKIYSDSKDKRQKRKLFLALRKIETFADDLIKVNSFLEQAGLPYQIIHKDFGKSNVLFRKNGEPVVVDFEIARMDWKIIDLINGWEQFCKNKSGFSGKKLKIFLNAYIEKQPLHEIEFNYIFYVWKYLNITRSIFFVNDFLTFNKEKSFKKALHYLKEANWNCEDYKLMKDIIGKKNMLIPE
jgi:Ser/Thr protein kinase RdoA (MazF antagonist)